MAETKSQYLDWNKLSNVEIKKYYTNVSSQISQYVLPECSFTNCKNKNHLIEIDKLFYFIIEVN